MTYRCWSVNDEKRIYTACREVANKLPAGLYDIAEDVLRRLSPAAI